MQKDKEKERNTNVEEDDGVCNCLQSCNKDSIHVMLCVFLSGSILVLAFLLASLCDGAFRGWFQTHDPIALRIDGSVELAQLFFARLGRDIDVLEISEKDVLFGFRED